MANEKVISMIRRILLATAGNGFDMIAMRHAIDLAQRHHAVISLVQVRPADYVDPWDQLIGQVKSTCTELELSFQLKKQRLISDTIGRLIDTAIVSGVHVNTMPATSDLVGLIKTEAPSHDLIVVGLRGLLESEVVEDCSPILAAVDESQIPLIVSPDYYKPIDKLIVATDGASLSPQAWEKFVDLQLGQFEQVTIAPFIDSTTDTDMSDGSHLSFHGIQSAATEFDLDLHPGIARRDLLQFVDESDADLVVLGDGGCWAYDSNFAQTVRQAERMLLMLPKTWTQDRHDNSNIMMESLAS